MLEIVFYIIWSGLAIVGVAALLGLIGRGFHGDAYKKNISIIPLCEASEKVQMIVYDAVNCSCRVIILDCGMDSEAMDICSAMSSHDNRIIVCKPDELEQAIMSSVGLQKSGE